MPDDQVEVETPWGKVKGMGALIVVVLALALGGVIYFVVTANEKEHAAQSAQGKVEHNGIVDALDRGTKTQVTIGDRLESIGTLIEEQNYMMLSDEKERKAIKDKLQRPSSLSKKLREHN